jgi:hypothetical protein
MTTPKILKFNSLDEYNHVIAGGIIGGKFDKQIGGLVGQTLTFTTPSGSKTFTAASAGTADSGFLRFGDVKTQLEAAINNLKVSLIDGNIAFKHATAGTAVVMANNTEPAKALLGFKDATTISGTAYAGASGTAPKVIDFTVEFGKIYVITEV